MNVPQINEVKKILTQLQQENIIESWELPYENILTRLTAAIFFVTPSKPVNWSTISEPLSGYEHFSQRENRERKLSKLEFRITFNKEEKEKNEKTN